MRYNKPRRGPFISTVLAPPWKDERSLESSKESTLSLVRTTTWDVTIAFLLSIIILEYQKMIFYELSIFLIRKLIQNYLMLDQSFDKCLDMNICQGKM